MGYLNDSASWQLRKSIATMECQIVQTLSEDGSFLSQDEMASLRWALSLARITKIKAQKDDKTEYITIAHATDRYRALLFAALSEAIGNSVNKEALKSLCPLITKLVKEERSELLSLFSQIPKNSLDDAIRRRPLALVLSGGGGTAYVFVGAFHAMEESGIIPSVITGSSMGAILGAYRARYKNFCIDGLDALVEKTSWSKVAQSYNGKSRFGVPATFRLYLRDVVGHEFLKDGEFIRISDLEIPLRVCVAGLSATYYPKEQELKKYASLLNKDSATIKAKSIIKAIMDFAQKPLKPIYLGGDALTKEFDVLDAIGFSAAIPGVFQYDILRNDPRMINLVTNLFAREQVIRLIDGGFVDNLPSKEAIKAVDDGECDGFDPLVLALDSFSPSFNRHLLFYPIMRFAVENSRLGHELAHISVLFKEVLSPVNLVPTKETFLYAIKNGYQEFSSYIPMIRKIIGPIPDPSWLK
jgi:hypothetical protein